VDEVNFRPFLNLSRNEMALAASGRTNG